jgi:hypothetical protein
VSGKKYRAEVLFKVHSMHCVFKSDTSDKVRVISGKLFHIGLIRLLKKKLHVSVGAEGTISVKARPLVK